MRLTQWLLILLIVLVSVIGYQQFKHKTNDFETCQEGAAWDEQTKQCDSKARERCYKRGYEWDEEGNRCLITDYQL